MSTTESADPIPLKVPPHSIEAEQSVLGSLMLKPDAWIDVIDILGVNDFYRSEHKIVFEAMDRLWRDNKPIDAITVADALSTKGQLDRIGGAAFLADLIETTPGTANAPAYARIVRDRSTLRQLIRAGQHITESGFEPDGRSSDDLVEEAERQVFAIAEGRIADSGPQPVTPLLDTAAEEVRKLYEHKGQLPGLPSGFENLDKMTTGFKDSDLIVIAGRPSMGKTALAMNIVEYAVVECDKPSVVFSLEMAAEQLVLRLLSSLARIDQSRMRIGELKDHDWTKFGAAVKRLKDRPLYIDDTPALTPGELRARVRRVAREADGVGLIAVDYLQLMRIAGSAENRTNEISEISRSLKALAKEMRCPVLALSQLNRDVERRQDRRPMMADLRDSGAIEQDADLILFIYRDEVYNEDSQDKGVAEIIIGKQRNGVTGKVRLSFLGELTKFENLAPDRYDDLEPP
ncbi:MAG: replicative DNA helicase [Gammaproteobacteria bacterium]|nr:replicative DNA helicase [Gammaproteobacteria bacterium]